MSFYTRIYIRAVINLRIHDRPDTVSFLHQAKTKGAFVIRPNQADGGRLILSLLVLPNFDPQCHASLEVSIIDYEIKYRKRFQRYEIFDKEKVS